MFFYILKRILATIPVMVIVAIFVFLLLRLTPGDPAAILAGDAATPAQLERIRDSLGLNDPLLVQFGTWMGQLLRGDLGTSLLSNTSVAGMIGDRLGPTLNIALMTIVISVALAVPMGVIAAWRHRSWVDFLVMSFSVLGFSVPVFVIGYILIQIFAIDLKWVPVQGYKSPTDGIGPFFSRAILPSLTLATIYIALIARMTRASMLEVLGEDYIRTARAKGMSPGRINGIHALRNALIPVITVIGLSVGTLLAGAILTETIFSWPGIGKWMVDSIFRRDYPVVQGGLLLIAVMVMVVNLTVDMLYGVINPKIRKR